MINYVGMNLCNATCQFLFAEFCFWIMYNYADWRTLSGDTTFLLSYNWLLWREVYYKNWPKANFRPTFCFKTIKERGLLQQEPSSGLWASRVFTARSLLNSIQHPSRISKTIKPDYTIVSPCSHNSSQDKSSVSFHMMPWPPTSTRTSPNSSG